MKVRSSIAKVVGAALALGGAASVVWAAPQAASGSEWYAPVAQAAAAGALKPLVLKGQQPASAPDRVGTPTMFLMKGVQLMHGHAKAPISIKSDPKLAYYGGPMLGNVKVQVVYWNKDVAYQDRLPGFYSTITGSPYFDWLKEYDAGKSAVGEGSYAGSYADSVPAASGSQIKDADIRAELGKLIEKGKVTQPDPNTLYMVYFPPGLNIDLDGNGSCQVFCAYHNTFLHGGQEVNYGVLPDQGGQCSGGCGSDADQFNNETSVSSHELIEAVTDPAVGLVQGNTPQAPLGWYDTSYGEIGDICNAAQAKVAGYVVQREWSNRRNLCVASDSDPGSPFVPPGW
ncbi:MAG: hypothetical protein KGL53_09305 [Elusimicrobia bacterium]|nr:hypothetical protein [Elusimicrobiota bacterium]